MIQMIKNTGLLFLITVLLFSCVPTRKYEDELARNAKLKQENEACKDRLTRMLEENDQLLTKLADLNKNNKKLVNENEEQVVIYNRIKKQYKDLNDLYEKVIKQNKDLLVTSSAQNQKLSLELEGKKRELEHKEGILAKLEATLKSNQANIDTLTQDLRSRAARVKELEDILSKKDAAVNELRDNLTKALLGFKENELSIEVKNGKVYISLSEKLLFKSGSIQVDSKGKEALKKLAEVLQNNPDINILIEGHTDNVPILGGEIKDNWDLSVLRATSIVKILKEFKIDQKRVIAAGRGEFFPVGSNETTEGKRKNRRTEIILTPKLDEIFKILENN